LVRTIGSTSSGGYERARFGSRSLRSNVLAVAHDRFELHALHASHGAQAQTRRATCPRVSSFLDGERIETESDLGDVGAERLRELKTKRDKVLRTLAKLTPMHSVPPYLYKPETIQRFQGWLRKAFLGSDRATARVYLQNLVDHIIVGEDEIIIEARAGAALAMMSSGPLPKRGAARSAFGHAASTNARRFAPLGGLPR
jgi:hypothetical protein